MAFRSGDEDEQIAGEKHKEKGKVLLTIPLCISHEIGSPYYLEMHLDEAANSNHQRIPRVRFYVLNAVRQNGQLAANVKH
ncbi:hypothetical protein EAI_09172 [Harpegnathos saltator]|uniref:Uncharacterized protein n=1 Tax=Harpegnathos saltator TaxID=610380 RepID=E2BFJ8_HARSA|nr:hypothetical protein EAI_09172 [Harpegnathos saltator]